MAKKTHIKVRMVPESQIQIANLFTMPKNLQKVKKQKIN